MFGGIYENIVNQTASGTLANTTDLVIVPSTVVSVLTITLALARAKDVVYVDNRSAYPQVVAVQSGDTLQARGLILPGQRVGFRSDNFSNWYVFSGPSNVQVAEIALSSANILGMNATPVTLIPAPGPGRVIVVNDIHLQMTTTSTQYANGGAVEFRYTNGSGQKVSADIAAAVITAAAGTSYTKVLGIEASITPVSNSLICITNATASFITGTGSGKLRIAYRIDDFN